MQLLVHIFVALCALAIGAAGYFGLALTVIESILAGLVAWCVCIVSLDRTVRRRSERRMEKGIDDLSRLLSKDAQAGQVLSQRINELMAVDADNRIAMLEADMSVLGTVVRQVAEAVSEIETAIAESPVSAVPAAAAPAARRAETAPASAKPVAADMEPVIPLEMLRQAIEEDRLAFHMMPIVTLPQRRTHGYDLVPRLLMEDGEFADAPDFMPRKGGMDVVRDIEWRGIEEAVTVIRRARTSGNPVNIFAPVSSASLADKASAARLLELFEANEAVTRNVSLRMTDREWRSLGSAEKGVVADIHGHGVRFSLTRARSLRLDFSELTALGVSSIRVDAGQFTTEPASLTDYHSSDIAAYVARFDINLIAENVNSEQQVLTVLEDGIKYAQGPHIAHPAPIRADLLVRRDAIVPEKRATGL